MEHQFKVGDRVRCIEEFHWKLEYGSINIIEEVSDQNGNITFDGKNYWRPSRFELVTEENPVKFDLKKDKWFIQVSNMIEWQTTVNWLKEKGFDFGKAVFAEYENGITAIGSWPFKGEFENPNGVRIGHTHSVEYWKEMGHKEIKLTLKTVVDAVEYPVIETQQQIELKALKQKAQELNEQIAKLEESL